MNNKNNLAKRIVKTLNIVNKESFYEWELEEFEEEIQYLLNSNDKIGLIEELELANEIELMNEVISY